MTTLDPHADAVIETAIVRWPHDSAAADPKLRCDRCGTELCDVEEGDSLSVLVRTALSHYDDECDPDAAEQQDDES